MPLEYRKDGGRLTWVRNPFTGAITYFTDVHKKISGFVGRTRVSHALERRQAEAERLAELEEAQRDCPFCPGNEHLTTAEVLRVRPSEVPGATAQGEWLIRVVYNLIPRIPECCTGDRNESYVVIEDPRHFADDAFHQEDLIYTALLPVEQFQAIIRAGVAVAKLAYENPAVKAVLIRKNQGRESGASQAHVHNQVIGSDLSFPPVQQEAERLRYEPQLWSDILRFAEREGLLISRLNGAVLYFCPFGVFPRSYEVVCPDAWGRINEVSAEQLDAFSRLLHEALGILGPLPLDYEIHDDPGVPLHAHVSARHFPYSNIGGTLNLPSNVPATYWREPLGRRR